jgi:gluconate 5-dehydrogenase
MDDLKEECASEGKQFFGLAVDLLDEKSIQEMVARAEKATGRIDILINAAGINILKKAEEYDAASWDKVLGINLRGLHLTTSAVGNVMIRQKYGRILSISSAKSFIGTDRDYAAYCASKGAVNMYTKQIACEWGKYGVTCNAIAPTFTRTPINAFQLDDPVFYQKLVDRIPLGRICTTQDLGNAAVFLCSDAAQFISGQILSVDGGLTANPSASGGSERCQSISGTISSTTSSRSKKVNGSSSM